MRVAFADAPQFSLKLHHAFSSVSSAHDKFLAPWARQVEAQSGGRIRIDLFPSMQLGGAPADLFDQARDGVVDLAWAQPEQYAGTIPEDRGFRAAVRAVAPGAGELEGGRGLRARQLGGRIPRGASDLLFLLRPRRAAHQPAGPHHRGDYGTCGCTCRPASPSKRCIGSARSPCRCRARNCRWRSPSTWSTAASIRGTWCRRSSSMICSRPTPNSPIRR